MINETHDQLQKDIEKAHEALRRELAKLRTGRANPDLLDSIRVDYYGSPTPLSQMANIGVPEPRMLTVQPWDKSQIKAIEKAIMESGLGLNPQNDGELIRLPMPQLNEERRRELVKFAKKFGEDCRVSIRAARHAAKDTLETLKKEKEAGEDEVERAQKKVEEIVQAGTSKVDDIVARKEKDILEV
ncbi:MAG: ribosome recycling factor [Myxococcales bacterium]|nr:MAG: ribosome recycling factor [Myxococcales bacterium]